MPTNIQQQTVPAILPGVCDIFDQNLKRLQELLGSLFTIGESIHGPVPSAVSNQKLADAPRPMPSIASRVRDLSEVIGEIEQVVGRIGDGL